MTNGNGNGISDRLIEKIQKLFALAGNNPNKAEAEVALNKAHELLEENNISMLEIERSTGKADNSRSDEKHSGALYKWQQAIWEGTAKMNFCRYFRLRGMTKGSKYEHRIVGRPSNATATQMMAEYLQGAIERYAREYAKDNDYASIFNRDVIIFREGMAAEITHRMWVTRWEREKAAKAAAAQNTGSTAVTLFGAQYHEEDLNTDYMNGWAPGTSSRMRAEREEIYRKWDAEAKLKQQAHDHRMETDPIYRADFELRRAADEMAAEKKRKQQERNDKRRGNSGYYRRENEEDRRRNSVAFRDGFATGRKVGLDQQVGKGTSGRGIE